MDFNAAEKDFRILINVLRGADSGNDARMAVSVTGRILTEPAAHDLQRLKALREKHKIDILGSFPD